MNRGRLCSAARPEGRVYQKRGINVVAKWVEQCENRSVLTVTHLLEGGEHGLDCLQRVWAGSRRGAVVA
jgi:hypothetical protein